MPYVFLEVEGAWVVKRKTTQTKGYLHDIIQLHTVSPIHHCGTALDSPARCIFSKVLSVQTFIVPFNLVPLRRTQPSPTIPKGSHEPLRSPSLFRTQSQQRLWVLVERELCLFVYLPITDLCSCRLIDIYFILCAITQYYFCY